MSGIRWWWILRRNRHAERFLLHYPASLDGQHQVLRVCESAGFDSAILIWNVCHACRRGLIAKISIVDEWQRQGLGRRLILRALRDGPDYTWTTTSQSPDGKRFFRVLGDQTATGLTPGPSCPHIDGAVRAYPRPLLVGVDRTGEPLAG